MSLKEGIAKELLTNFYIRHNILKIGKWIISNVQKPFVLVNKLAATSEPEGI